MSHVSGYDTSPSTAEAKATFVKNGPRRLKVARPSGQTSARVPVSYLQRERERQERLSGRWGIIRPFKGKDRLWLQYSVLQSLVLTFTTAAKVPSWMPLWLIKHEKQPSTMPFHQRKHDEVPFRVPIQWRKCDKEPSRIPFH